MRDRTDRIEAESFQQFTLHFPRALELVDNISMDIAIGQRRKTTPLPEAEHAALLARKGMQVTRPPRRKRA